MNPQVQVVAGESAVGSTGREERFGLEGHIVTVIHGWVAEVQHVVDEIGLGGETRGIQQILRFHRKKVVEKGTVRDPIIV